MDDVLSDSGQRVAHSQDHASEFGRRAFLVAIAGLGFSAFLTQVTLMRELVTVFAGNELIYGIVLGVWLLLTGVGSRLGASAGRIARSLEVFLAAQVLVAVLPIVGVFALRTMHNVVFVRGAAVGVSEAVLVCVVLLAPYCVIAGYLLTLASHLAAAVAVGSGQSAVAAGSGLKGPDAIGRVYFLDSVGGIVGGLIFSLVLVLWLDHFQILYTAAAVNLACVLALGRSRLREARIREGEAPAEPNGIADAGHNAAARREPRSAKITSLLVAAAGFLLLLLVATAACFDLDAITARLYFWPQSVVFRQSSPYGSLAVTESAGQYNFLENGVVLFSTHNLEEVEETVHYAMAQRPDAHRVLLISGGVSGTAKEILKYPARVDYVELDPLILRVAREFLPESLADPRIEVINTDGRLFVRQTDRRYDVILIDVPDPTTSQINRFYTEEFLAEAKARLAERGVLALAMGRYENRISGDLARAVAAMHNTLSARFANVLVIPTQRLRFLASDGPLTTEIADRLKAAKIPVRLLDPYYLKTVLAPDRMADVTRVLSTQAPINRDFSPILYFYHLRYWMSQFRISFGLLEGLLIAGLLVFLVRMRSVSFAVFSSGFAASALEVVLLLGFQILFGSIYYRLGLIVTMFMLGLGIGSLTMNRSLAGRRPRDLVLLELAIALAAASMPACLAALGKAGSGPIAVIASQAAIYLLTLVVAVLVGLMFPLAAKLDFQDAALTASRLYTADYLGAALGALLVSTLLVPLIGVWGVCLLAAVLNLAGAAAVAWRLAPG